MGCSPPHFLASLMESLNSFFWRAEPASPNLFFWRAAPPSQCAMLLHIILWFLVAFATFGPLDCVMGRIRIPGHAGVFGRGKEHWVSQAIMAVCTIILDLVLVSIGTLLLDAEPYRSVVEFQQACTIVSILVIMTRQECLLERLKSVAQHFKEMGF